MPARNAKPYNPKPRDPHGRHLTTTPGLIEAIQAPTTTIAEATVVFVEEYLADLIVGGRPVGTRAVDSSVYEFIEKCTRNLVPLPIDAGFYATLSAADKVDYLRVHTVDGLRRGRILWHRTADDRSFLTVPALDESVVPEGYHIIEVYEVQRDKKGKWRRVD